MILKILLIFVPITIALHYSAAPPMYLFGSAMIGIIPLADRIRKSTEDLAHTVGSGIGGLLNVTFGNAAEFIIALIILSSGNAEIVKATITGSIVGNSLLGLGLSVIIGSVGRDKQTFSRERAGLLSSLLLLSVIAMLTPALFDYTERAMNSGADRVKLDEYMSLGVSCVLILAYGANLIYTFITHRDVFSREGQDEGPAEVSVPPVWQSVALLIAATGGVAIMAEYLSSSLDATAKAIGLTEFFIGVVLLPIIGNIAEYISAFYFARKNNMDMVMTIAVGSSIQIALFSAPLLVLISFMMGNPMNLVFSNPLELIAIASVAFTINAIAHDGETTWFEGVLLTAAYTVFAIAFFFVE